MLKLHRAKFQIRRIVWLLEELFYHDLNAMEFHPKFKSDEHREIPSVGCLYSRMVILLFMNQAQS